MIPTISFSARGIAFPLQFHQNLTLSHPVALCASGLPMCHRRALRYAEATGMRLQKARRNAGLDRL
jgi:hypothetical protein